MHVQHKAPRRQSTKRPRYPSRARAPDPASRHGGLAGQWLRWDVAGAILGLAAFLWLAFGWNAVFEPLMGFLGCAIAAPALAKHAGIRLRRPAPGEKARAILFAVIAGVAGVFALVFLDDLVAVLAAR